MRVCTTSTDLDYNSTSVSTNSDYTSVPIVTTMVFVNLYMYIEKPRMRPEKAIHIISVCKLIQQI